MNNRRSARNSYAFAVKLGNTCEWRTPREIYDGLDAEFHFQMDGCAAHGKEQHDNHVAFGGLQAAWKGVVWCNPPYGQGTIDRWVAKARGHAERGEATVVMLVPSRTDAAWFHDHVLPYAEIRFMRGRLNFDGGRKKGGGSAPFPSAVLVFRARESTPPNPTGEPCPSCKGLKYIYGDPCPTCGGTGEAKPKPAEKPKCEKCVSERIDRGEKLDYETCRDCPAGKAGEGGAG
jgi:phage N-6-adenine-methyltransferase